VAHTSNYLKVRAGDMTSSEVRAEGIPWIMIVVLTFIFGFFGPVWVMMMPTSGSNWYTPGFIACKLFVPVLPLILIFGASILGRVTPLGQKINASAYAFLYAVGLGVAVFGTYDSWPIGDFYAMILADRVVNPVNGGLWPSFMAPTAGVVELSMAGSLYRGVIGYRRSDSGGC